MEIIDELEEDCRVLSLVGVLAKVLEVQLDMDFIEAYNASVLCADELYKYARSFAEAGEVPAIMFTKPRRGEFGSVDCVIEKGEVM